MQGRIEVQPLTASVGARVHGLDLREPLSDDAANTLEQALHRHLVLFFRDQDLSPRQQVDFARRFGPVGPHPFAKPHPDQCELTVLDQTTPETDGTNSWHSDSTFMPEPPLGSVLHARLLPPLGGDTCWANMYAAYEALSPPIRRLVDGLQAEHDISWSLRKSIGGGHSVTSDLRSLQDRWPPQTHPVVRTHPRTGRRCLYVNRNFTTRLCELDEQENDVLLPLLFRQASRPEFQVRFRWRPGDVAFWDNRCTQHFAVPDYTGHRRVMHRVMIQGDRPH